MICEFESCQVDKKVTAAPRGSVTHDGPSWRGWKVEEGQRLPNLTMCSLPLGVGLRGLSLLWWKEQGLGVKHPHDKLKS